MASVGVDIVNLLAHFQETLIAIPFIDWFINGGPFFAGC
jgi:hypothetical protein